VEPLVAGLLSLAWLGWWIAWAGRAVPVGGASETGGMNETGVALSQEPDRDIFMIAEVLMASNPRNLPRS